MSVPDPRLEAVVFDFDGVIVDSETPEYEAYRDIFERCGTSLTIDDWTAQVGVWTDDQDRRWHRRLCLSSTAAPAFDAFQAEKRQRFAERLSLVPMPGIRALLAALASAGIPTAIASSSPASWVLTAAAQLDVTRWMAAIVTADDVQRRKPEPDVYLEAVRRLGVSPARAIALEDSGPGVRAARSAGLKTVAIPHRLTEQHDLRAADLRVASAVDLTLGVLRGLMVDDAR